MKKFLMLLVFCLTTYAQAYKQEDLAKALTPKYLTVQDLDLRGANLANKNFTLKTFVSVDFRGADLSKATFIGCMFIDCIFVDATIENTLFQEAQFCGCNLLKMVGTPCNPKENLLPCFDKISKLTLSGKEDASLYFKNGEKLNNLNITVSGLCRKIFNEATTATHKDD